MHKAVFPEKPAVRPLAGPDYELAQTFDFPARVEGAWEVVVHVRPGFRTDGASIPRLLWRVFGSPYDPDIFPAAIGHDALYRGELLPRKDADAAFLAMMEANGVPRRKRRLVWLGVRLFGWITWMRHTEASVAGARRHIDISFASHEGGQQAYNNKKGQTMKKMTMIVVAACAAAMTGCTTCSIETPEWKATMRSHWLKRDVDKLDVQRNADGSYSVALNGYRTDASEQFPIWTRQMWEGLGVVARIAATAYNPAASAVPLTTDAANGANVAKIVKANAEASAIQATMAAFAKAGGDASKAKVTCTDGSCTITDGTTTCVDGVCTSAQ